MVKPMGEIIQHEQLTVAAFLNTFMGQLQSQGLFLAEMFYGL
jgi:hypothetical protein